MNKFSLYYIISNFILFSALGASIYQYLVPICLLGLFTVGVAHGSIDHILSEAGENSKKRVFIKRYLLLILAVGFAWFIEPNVSVLLFLTISSYHFGQSQFVNYTFQNLLWRRVLYLAWGVFLFSLLLLLNAEELLSSFPRLFPDIVLLPILVKYSLLSAICSGILWLGIFLYHQILQQTIHTFFSELYIIVLIGISFYVLPIIIGFSLYFIILHSLPSMDEEFKHLFKKYSRNNFWKFFKLLAPFTTLAAISSIAIVLFSLKMGLSDHIPFILLLLLSCVTTPHAIVMDRFFQSNKHLSI